MSVNDTGSARVPPGFRHILEAALFFGAIGGLTDVSYIFTRHPGLIAELLPGLRFVGAGFFLTFIAYLLYLLVVLLVLRPLASSRKWTLKFSLAILYMLAFLPAGAIIARNFASILASQSILVAQVKVIYYFLKYLWVLIPVSWAVGAWLANVRTSYHPSLLTGRLSAVALSAGIFLVATPFWQQRYLLAKANIYSEVAAGRENMIISIVVFVIALLLLPLISWICTRIANARSGLILGALWLIGMVIPFIPPLLSGPPITGSQPSGAELSGRPSNVMLVSLDTTRYDDLGFNGNEIVNTPALDSIAGSGVVFDNAITPMPITGPAHISMLTGFQPDSETGHGVKSNGIPLQENIPTLATVLDEAGYNTGAVISGFPLAREASGIERGFHHYHDVFDQGLRARFLPDQIWYLTVMKIIRKAFNIKEGIPHGRQKSADIVTDQTIEWLEINSDDPFFMFVHYFDPHYLYAPPTPFNSMYMPDYNGTYKDKAVSLMTLLNQIPTFSDDDFEYYRSMYRGEISFMDREFGRLVEWGNERDLWDNTLLIIVADHGESFEHNYYFNHPDRVYDQLIKVPLIVRDPDAINNGITEKRLDNLVNVSDLYFTVLNFLGVKSPRTVDSMHERVPGAAPDWDHNILGLIHESDEGDSGTQSWDFIASQSYSFAAPGDLSLGRFFCFRFPDWKIIYGPDAEPKLPKFQYFDLTTDPVEMNDIFPEIDLSQMGLSGIIEMLEVWSALQGAADLSTMDPQMRAELEALGYLQ